MLAIIILIALIFTTIWTYKASHMKTNKILGFIPLGVYILHWIILPSFRMRIDTLFYVWLVWVFVSLALALGLYYYIRGQAMQSVMNESEGD